MIALRARFLVLVFVVCLFAPGAGQLKKRKEVSIGYMLNFNPWKLAVNLGTFERVTGYTIKWLEITDSYKATVALANGEVELVIANAADIARAFSRDVGCRLVYICEEIDNSEALVIHKDWHADNGGPIRSPGDLVGRAVHVGFGSTAHFALVSLLNEMQIPVEADSAYKRGETCTLEPCHWVPNPRAVLLIGMRQDEILERWNTGEIIATYGGLPELTKLKEQGGVVLLTNRLMAQWQKVTFAGVIASTTFLDKTIQKYRSYNVRNFMELFIGEMAKANFYFTNNTKEFATEYQLDTIGTTSVSSAIASVTGGYDVDEVYKQLQLRRYPTMEEQVSCEWMGCKEMGRVANALKEMSKFFNTLKEDYNVPRKSSSEIKFFSLPVFLDDYSKFIDISYMQYLIDAGTTGNYPLDAGAYVHLGYEIMAQFGPTRSLLVT